MCLMFQKKGQYLIPQIFGVRRGLLIKKAWLMKMEETLYFAMYNVHFFAQIFEGKIRM